MDRIDELRGWIRSLALNLELDLDLDENDVCTLEYSEGVCMSLMPSPSSEEHFVMIGPVMVLTRDPAVDYHIYRSALKLSFLGDQTWGGTLGLGVQDGFLVLGFTLPYDACDEIVLENGIVNFTEAVGTLKDMIIKDLELLISCQRGG